MVNGHTSGGGSGGRLLVVLHRGLLVGLRLRLLLLLRGGLRGLLLGRVVGLLGRGLGLLGVVGRVLVLRL